MFQRVGLGPGGSVLRVVTMGLTAEMLYAVSGAVKVADDVIFVFFLSQVDGVKYTKKSCKVFWNEKYHGSQMKV